MGTQITFRRGSSFPTAGSGITLAEPVFETTLHTFHIGLGHGVTAEWVGAPISGLSADIGAGITYKIPTAASVLNYISGLCFGITNGVRADAANTFTALQSFSSGISASGITVNGNMSVTGNFTVSGGVTFTTSETVLIEDNIITLNSNVTGSPSENAGVEIERGTSANVQLLWNESSDKWTFTNDGSIYYDLPTSVVTSFNGSTGAVQGVSSFNGLTGAVGGVCAAQANTFTALQSFNSGISSAGGTFTQEVRFASGLTATVVKTLSLSGNGTLSPSFIDGQFRLSQLMGTFTTVQTSGSTDRTITLPDANGTVALTSQLMGAVNGLTAATTAVTSFNGLTGAVGGVTTSAANTFTAVQTFNSGVTFASTIDATGAARLSGGLTASRIDVNGNFRVVGDSQIGDQNTDTLTVFAGTTFNNRTDFAGNNNFANGLTSSGNIRFSGTSAKTISSNQATLTIAGVSTSPILIGSNSVVMGVQVTDSLTLNSATSIVDISTTTSGVYPTIPSIRIITDDGDTIGAGSIKITPSSYATANRTQYLQDASGTVALTSQLMGAVNGSTAATTAVTSFNGLTGAVTGVTVGGVNTFTQVNTFSAGISAAGSTFSSTTNTLDVIASTEGAGLRIARATSGTGSRIGGIRLGRSTTTNLNTYIEGSAGTFSLYNGVDNTGTAFASFSPTQFALGTTATSFITFNCPNNISFGDQGAVGNNQVFSISGTARTYTFGDSNGITTGFVGINRSGLCADYALEVNSPTGKGLQLIYNDHTGAASNWVNMDVSSGGNYTLRPSGGLATVTGTLNVSAGISAAGGVTFGGTVASDTGYRITSNAINAQTGTTYTFLSSDNGKVVTFNNGSTTTVTIPASLPIGFNCTAIQLGAGQVGFTAASGVTMNAYASAYKISGQHGAAALVSYTTNIFNLSGTLSV